MMESDSLGETLIVVADLHTAVEMQDELPTLNLNQSHWLR